jgi:transcriptional regulator with XRE-family HTH domain
MYNKDFGKQLAELREKAGYSSQRQFALAVGVSSASISRIESGDQQVEPETLEKFAPVLKVDHKYLMQKAGYLEDRIAEEKTVYSVGPDNSTILEIARRLQKLPEKDIKVFENLLGAMEKENPDK